MPYTTHVHDTGGRGVGRWASEHTVVKAACARRWWRTNGLRGAHEHNSGLFSSLSLNSQTFSRFTCSFFDSVFSSSLEFPSNLCVGLPWCVFFRCLPLLFLPPFVAISRQYESKSGCIYRPIPLVLVSNLFSFFIPFFILLSYLSTNLISQPTNQCLITHHHASSSTLTLTSISSFKVQRWTPVSFSFFVLFTNPNFRTSQILVRFRIFSDPLFWFVCCFCYL